MQKYASDCYSVGVIHEIGVAESISGDTFATGSIINALNAHALTLSLFVRLNVVN